MVPCMATHAVVNRAAVDQFLRDRNRSLRWLATELDGMDPGHLSRLLSGKRPMRADLFFRIAAKLEVDPEAIGALSVPAAVAS